MKKPTTILKESVSEYREFVQLRLRMRVLEAIEVVLEEEVDQALGCCSYERAEDRRGYRNGAETRRVTTSVGTCTSPGWDSRPTRARWWTADPRASSPIRRNTKCIDRVVSKNTNEL